MPRSLSVLLLVAAAFAPPACGKKKEAPRQTTQPQAMPQVTKRPEAPPPPLTADQKVRIEADFQAARELANKARELRLTGERIEREQGPQAAAESLGKARKLYREAAQKTEKWVEPELNEVSDRQLKADSLLISYFEERGAWIKEDASMGQKLNVK